MDSPLSPTEELTIAQAIANLEQIADPSLRYYAAWWLGKFRVNQPEAIEALIAALKDEVDRTPDGGYPLRRNAARALGKLGQGVAVLPLIESLDCPDYYVRESATQSLGELKDPRCAGKLQALLTDGLSDFSATPGTAHLRQPYDSIIESLGEIGATEAIVSIQPFLEHPVPRIRYAAARSLYQLTGDAVYGEMLVAALQEPELQLRRSVLMDLGACGYLEGAEAIAQTPAENSLKLVALKGLLSKQLASEPWDNNDRELPPSAIRVMSIMDSLL